uniref:Uncharacterized protein n=1 Tax=Triticum urartu TaxID=4572 RepID=A0A8R7UM81_TRIUA
MTMDTTPAADGLCILGFSSATSTDTGFSSSSPVLTGIGLYTLGLPRDLLTPADAAGAGGSSFVDPPLSASFLGLPR